MANCFEKNEKNLLQSCILGYGIVNYIKNLPDNREKIKKIEGQLQFEYQGQYYLLHSRNERNEADRLLKMTDEKKDYFLFIYGMGNLTLVRKLIEATSEQTKILLVEENPYVLKYYMYKEDLEDILLSKKIVLTVGQEELYKMAVQLCMSSGWDSYAYNLNIIQLPNCHVYKEILKEKLEYLTKEIRVNIQALGNDLTDMMMGMTNNYINVDQCILSNSLSEIRGKYKNVPGIVVAAGPSLDKNIQYLKEAYGKAVIIACDATYQMCLQQGVIPDAIAAIERVEETYHCFFENKKMEKETVFVGPSLVWKDILEEYPGKKILLSKTADGVEAWWQKQFDNIEYLPTGFSCANVAHAVLEQAGCNLIILIGQDLAYTDGKKHSEEVHRLFGDSNQVPENSTGDLWVEGIDGKPVRTTPVFNLFRDYFERAALDKGRLLIDATEGGAKIHGTKIMPFKEAIDTYCTKPKQKNMDAYLKEIQWDEIKAEKKYHQIIRSAEEVIETIETLETMMKNLVRKIGKYQDMDFQTASKEQLIQCVKDMEGGNDLLKYVQKENTEIANFYKPLHKNIIMNVKRLGNELDGQSVLENYRLQLRMIFMMQIISKNIKEEFQKMVSHMEQKLEK